MTPGETSAPQKSKDDVEEETNNLIDRLAEEMEKQEERVLKLEATVFQLANYNFVFQGVILMAAINGSSTLRYRFVWFPFSLSLIATLLNFATLIIMSRRYADYLNKLDKKIYIWYTNANKSGKGDEALYKKNKEQEKQRKIAFYVSMTMFVAFSLVMATATAVIPHFHHN